jgi:hypothetical protein
MLEEYKQRGGKFHTRAQCRTSRESGAPKNCVIHNPSKGHPLAAAPKVLRETGLVEDACPHGIGHPNPDSLAYFTWATGQDGWGIHGCDGCCRKDPT